MIHASFIRNFFPIESTSDFVKFFDAYLSEFGRECNLAFLSILVGFIENELIEIGSQLNLSTLDEVKCEDAKSFTYSFDNKGAFVKDISRKRRRSFPFTFSICFEDVESLYEKFASFILGLVPVTTDDLKCTSRDLLKLISNTVWNGLQRNYQKDRAHMQSVYSYLTTSRLDSFGVAFTVVAACQIVGLEDVHLTVSEDHVWVTFGDNDTAEVTWHGRGIEDRRGQPVDAGISDRLWLYLNGDAMVCDRFMEIASSIASINFSITEKIDSKVLIVMQQQLLWILYNKGYIDQYPTVLAHLGDLEDIEQTNNRFQAVDLYQAAIKSSFHFYNDAFIYPYIYLGKHCLRKNKPRDAFANWAKAAKVISRYSYSKEDEEAYRDFFEIAHQCIPDLLKLSDVKNDPICFCYLIQFMDGICLWEEGSQTPILHITWAQALTPCLLSFPFSTRSAVRFYTISDRNVDVNGNKQIPKDCSVDVLARVMSQTIFSPLFIVGAAPSPEKRQDPFKIKDKVALSIYSNKMCLLADILLAEKVAASAVSLQLTAQANPSGRRKVRSALPLDYINISRKKIKSVNSKPPSPVF